MVSKSRGRKTSNRYQLNSECKSYDHYNNKKVAILLNNEI